MAPGSERSDEEWRVAIAQRDEEAFQELQSFLYRWTYGLLYTRLPWISREAMQDLAADCTQDVIIQIMQRLNQYRGTGPFLGWCRVVAVNLATGRVRTEARRRQREKQETETEDEVGEESAAHPVEKAVFLRECGEHVEAFIKTGLTAAERRVFLALVYDEKTRAELAIELNTTRNNIYQIYLQARKRLRAHLEHKGYNEEELRRVGYL